MNSKLLTQAGITCDSAASVDSQQEQVILEESVSRGRRLKRSFWHVVAHQFTLMCVIAVKLSGLLCRRKRRLLPGEECDIMLTGRFDSDNWILAHLGPLSASKECSRIWMVSTNHVPEMPKVTGIYPSKFLMKIMGKTSARLITFFWSAMKKRPHIVGGFHIMVNGIAAVIAGRLIGARSMYFCVGGPAEVSDGGIHSADSYFTGMEISDAVVEKRLLKIISQFDIIITMGTRAAKYFHGKGISTDFHVLSGGIDKAYFRLAEKIPSYDLIVTGRIVEVKRVDVFLQTVKLVADKIPEVKVLIVGNGKLLTELKQLARELNLDRNVHFVGYQKDVENWLQQSRIFVLTSDSEGLSLSLMEAMMCGLPAVVSNVGDLGDLVKDGVNGYLVSRRCPEKFAARIIELLTDKNKLKTFSLAARTSALNYSTQAATAKWDHIIQRWRQSSVTRKIS